MRRMRIVYSNGTEELADTLLDAQQRVKRKYQTAQFPHAYKDGVQPFWKDWVAGFPAALAVGRIEELKE